MCSYTSESSLTFELRNLVLKETLLHQVGYVYGDLRDTNLMVRKDGQSGFMLVDFDWAGKFGEVCYPMNVNGVLLVHTTERSSNLTMIWRCFGKSLRG